MASVCISNCVNDTCLPVRPTYVNMYKWPESDVEFVKTVNSNNHPSGVDSLHCRQMYTEKTMKCLSRLKESVVCARNRLNLRGEYKSLGRAKDVTHATFFTIFHKLLLCSPKVDVAHHDF